MLSVMQEHRAAKIVGVRGGFIITRGKPRYAQLEGRHFAIARGVGYECATIEEAYAQRDYLCNEEAAKYKAKRVAELAPVAVPAAIAVGVAVEIDKGPGVVEEVGARSALVKTRDGNLWRRAFADCKAVA